MCSCSFSAGGHLSCLVFSELLESLVWRRSLSEDRPALFSLPHSFAFPMNTFKYLSIIPQFLATLLFFLSVSFSLFLRFSSFYVIVWSVGLSRSAGAGYSKPWASFNSVRILHVLHLLSWLFPQNAHLSFH